jgi:hypothetical protein
MINQPTRLIDMPLTHIKIQRRIRSEMGDLDALSDSIREVGLLQPIVITPAGRLIAGHRRLEACRLLGMESIPCCIAENLTEAWTEMQAEVQENTCRKRFLPSEAVRAARDLEPMARGAASRRMRHQEEEGACGNLPQGGKSMDKIASLVDMSRHTLEKAIKVVEAGHADPQTYYDLVEKMDRTGKVNGVYQEMLRRQSPQPRKAPDFFSIRMDRSGGYKVVGFRDKAEIIANLKLLIRLLEEDTYQDL